MIPFLSFDYQNNIIREDLISSIKNIIDSNSYVLGQNVLTFEKKYSELSDVKYAIGVGSGLDALTIALKALNVKSSDEVIVASNSYIACWLSISNVGAKIVPVEPDSDTFNIDPNLIRYFRTEFGSEWQEALHKYIEKNKQNNENKAA